MKRFGLLGLLLVGMASPVWAAEKDDLQKILGGFRTADVVASGSAQEITGFGVDCGGTACNAAVYDGDGLEDATDANGVFEISAAANATAYVDLTGTPIRTTTGVVVIVDNNVDAAAVYTAQSP